MNEIWTFDTKSPTEWPELVGRCGGGFFHSPHGLLSSAAPGEPIFATLRRDDDVTGIALGVRTGCRFSLGKRHLHFPTVPAVSSREQPERALTALVCSLRRFGAADVTMDSFDAAYEMAAQTAAETTDRLEYTISLEDGQGSRESALCQMHRRHIRRGERDGWSLSTLVGKEAWRALTDVHESAVNRAYQRGRGFEAELPRRAVDAAVETPGAGSGLTVFAARGDALLAAALVGWANRSGYYLAGGSTPAGYRSGVAAWMQWRVMEALRERGFVRYSLGGTPAGAALPDHPAHGLYRFKSGMGADVVHRRSARWVLSPAHLTAHRWLQRTVGAERRRQRA